MRLLQLSRTDFVIPLLPTLQSSFLGIQKFSDLIDSVDSQRPSYRSTYSLGPMELDTLKTYFDTNLTNGFTKPFKLVTDDP